MCQSDTSHELPVTFRPELYLQRRGWVLDIMRRECITEVLDIGCGEGELLACLCNPAPWLAPPPPHVLPRPRDEDVGDLADLHRDILHPVKIAGLDVSPADLADAVEATRPLEAGGGSGALWHEPVRWEPLEVRIWQGSLARVNPEFVDVECIVSTEVIEHLPEDVLLAFAPVVFGAYHPRVVLLTTPSYTFNSRFTAPDAPMEARSGWPDPTKRTSRIFRHPDHKFEWTVKEFADWCKTVAEEWGYNVELGGVGKAHEVDQWGRDEALGFASLTAMFKRREGSGWADLRAKRVDELGILGAADEERKTPTAGHTPPSSSPRRRPSAAAVSYRRACGVQSHAGLSLGGATREGHTLERVVLLDHDLYELIPLECEASPPDSGELTDPWDPFDEDDTWQEKSVDIVCTQNSESSEQVEWGPPESNWDRSSQSSNTEDEVKWGPPESDWPCSSQWM
ncbi:hypothetical protein BN946_scf184945.g61 [Trametes cinnabarina]|uniref:Small RNA 2'-O-methyltransferase n=1 Tax=Pycnoporus cinnabarinus TaxID=5643 RepID=A0A060SRZ0_PYCCI|nr:hypothetical protein BN946_scf184945.g61 [Trametes cinnabarina]